MTEIILIMRLEKYIFNKIVLYLASRYFTYGLQFLTSIIIAAKLGPYYLGIWGFIMLILSYFQQFNFGIGNSFNVLYVQNNEDTVAKNKITINSLFLIIILCIISTIVFSSIYVLNTSHFNKYHLDTYVVWICIIAILQYLQSFFIGVFRVTNKLLYITISQSIVVILNFLALFICDGKRLIDLLLYGYVLGLSITVILAITSGIVTISKMKCIDFSYQKIILKKGILLFLYNTCFYFIVISVRSIISNNYSVTEFGLFTFSYTLAHAFLLLLDSISFIVFPKVVRKLSVCDVNTIPQTMAEYRNSYMTVAHIIIYVALPLIPVILSFLPEYSEAELAIQLTSLSILMYTNCCGYSELLISRNKEKISATLSCLALVLNCGIACFLVYYLRVTFHYVIVSIMITYALYSIAVIYMGKRLYNSEHVIEAINMVITPKRSIPYISALLFCVMCNADQWYFMCVPLIIYLMLNFRSLRDLVKTTHKILTNPNSVNL